MGNPWDSPPLPIELSRTPEPVYIEVGRVLSSWEGIEVQLSRIYSFVNNKPDDIPTMDLYGDDRRIFVIRFGNLNVRHEHCSFPGTLKTLKANLTSWPSN